VFLGKTQKIFGIKAASGAGDIKTGFYKLLHYRINPLYQQLPAPVCLTHTYLSASYFIISFCILICRNLRILTACKPVEKQTNTRVNGKFNNFYSADYLCFIKYF
jgi:hypothetical protein